MKNIPLVSIIVPVYNVEPYIDECLRSLEKQTLYNIEVILVNDGSTDGSVKILKQYVEKDARFVYFEQPNQGLSAARNTGLLNAIGDYIAFVDSDDWLSLTALESLYNTAVLTGADIVAGNVMTVHTNHTITSWGRRGRDCLPVATPMRGFDYFSMAMEKGCYIMMVYNYLYRRVFLQSQSFRFESVIHEDELWTPQILIAASFVVAADIDFYYYRQRENSLTTGCKVETRVNSLLFIITKLLLYAKKVLIDEEYMEARECIYVKILQLYILVCSLDAHKSVLYDKLGEILILENQLVRWNFMGIRLTRKILIKIRENNNLLYIYYY